MCTNLNTHHQYMRFLVHPQLCQNLALLSFIFQTSWRYSMTYRWWLYFDSPDYQGCGIFFQCLIHWITSFSKFLFEDSVHCLFYFVIFRTCLCGSKLYLCVCMCIDEKTSLNFHVCKSYFTICFIYSVLFSVYIFFKYLFI